MSSELNAALRRCRETGSCRHLRGRPNGAHCWAARHMQELARERRERVAARSMREPSAIQEEHDQVCAAAKAAGWPDDLVDRLLELEDEHARAMRSRGLASVRGFPLHPGHFRRTLDLLNQQNSFARQDPPIDPNSPLGRDIAASAATIRAGSRSGDFVGPRFPSGGEVTFTPRGRSNPDRTKRRKRRKKRRGR